MQQKPNLSNNQIAYSKFRGLFRFVQVGIMVLTLTAVIALLPIRAFAANNVKQPAQTPPNQAQNNNKAAQQQANTKPAESTAPGAKVEVPKIDNPTGEESLTGLVTKAIKLALYLIVIAAAVVIVISGYTMVVGSANPATVKTARQSITYAILGMILAMASFAIVTIIQGTLGK